MMLDMALENIQKVATSVNGKYNTHGVKWWNSSPMSRQCLKLYVSDVKEVKLDTWLSIVFFGHMYHLI